MGQTIYDSTRVNTRVTAMRTVNNIGKILVIVAGILAIVHLVCLRAERPLLCLARVSGDSMAPTLKLGDRVLFARRAWRVGSIILARVGEQAPVIKRVQYTTDGYIFISGNNKQVSQVYWIRSPQIVGVMVWRLPR